MIRYYVTDRRGGDVARFAERAVRNGVDMIQIREKDLSTKDLLNLVVRIRDIARGSKTRVLVNDRLDVAMAAAIDGVHIPGNGLPAERVRGLVQLVGVSVHSVEAAIAAEQAKADFIVFGPIFDTPGKSAAGIEELRRVVRHVTIPVLGIGGIDEANASQVMDAGAAGIAAIRLFQNTGRS